MADVLDIFNQEIVENINNEFIEKERDFEEIELIRDGAILQINQEWPNVLEKLTLAPDGVSAIETLLNDDYILKRFILMQRLTEIVDHIHKMAEEDSAKEEE